MLLDLLGESVFNLVSIIDFVFHSLRLVRFSNYIDDYPAGRLEDSLLGGKRNADTLGLGTGKRSGMMWNNFSGHHAFTTGRGGGGGGSGRGNDSVPFMSAAGKSSGGASGRPKGPSQTLKVRESRVGAACV